MASWQKIQRARWVMAAMEQRQRTVTLIAQALLRFQREFFLGGELAAVTLRQAAREIGVHESTVSRAVSGKHLLSRAHWRTTGSSSPRAEAISR